MMYYISRSSGSVTNSSFLTKRVCLFPNYHRYFSLYSGNTKKLVTEALKPMWGSVNNQRDFMDNLAKELNIKDQNGWYKISTELVKKHGGRELLRFHKNSLLNLLQTVYPEYHIIQYHLITNVFFTLLHYIPVGCQQIGETFTILEQS